MAKIGCGSCLGRKTCQSEWKKQGILCSQFTMLCPDCGDRYLKWSKKFAQDQRLTSATFPCDGCGSVYEINAVPAGVSDEEQR